MITTLDGYKPKDGEHCEYFDGSHWWACIYSDEYWGDKVMFRPSFVDGKRNN